MTDRETTAVAERPTYAPTEEERAAIGAAVAKDCKRRRLRAPDVRVKGRDDGTCELHWDHPDRGTAEVLAQIELGTNDGRLFNGLMAQIVALGSTRETLASAQHMNTAVACIAAVEPRDGVEAMLATQMAATHLATMEAAGRLARFSTLPQHDAYERAFNKLARTFATQMETLKRHRSKGQQVVRVERVTVQEGGQAIVGHVETGGRSGGRGGDET